MAADVIHPDPQLLANCRKWLSNSSQQLVDGVNIGDQFVREDCGTVHTCQKINWIDRYFYGYEDSDPWTESKYVWVPARHVKPYTLLDVILG